MKKFYVFIIVLLSSAYLYSQVESNPVITEEYLLNPMQKNIVPGNDLKLPPHEIQKSNSKAFKYRQIAQMQEVLTGGLMQYHDSATFEYIFNEYVSNLEFYLWDVIHWAYMNKAFTTYDQNYNRLSYEVFKFDGLNWLPNTQTLYTYNTFNEITSSTDQLYLNTTASWTNISRNVYEYDIKGYVILRLEQSYSYSSSVWQNSSRFLYINNDSGKVLTTIYQTYDTPNSKWKNTGRTENTYDAQINLLIQTFLTWNSTTLVWDNFSKTIFTYDASRNKLTEIFYRWASGSWVESDKTTYTYDGLNILSKILQTWNTTLSQWVNSDKYEYTYNSNNLLLTKNYFDWNNTTSVWINIDRDMYIYDGNGNQILKTSSHWVSGAWVDNSRTLDTYDVNQNKYKETYDKWDVPTSAWITQNNNYLYWEQYEENQGIIDPEAKYVVNVYPNPVSTYLNIESPFEVQKLDLYNSTGQLVLSSLPAENRINLDLGIFTNGIYFLQLQTINRKISKKIQISR